MFWSCYGCVSKKWKIEKCSKLCCVTILDCNYSLLWFFSIAFSFNVFYWVIAFQTSPNQWILTMYFSLFASFSEHGKLDGSTREDLFRANTELKRCYHRTRLIRRARFITARLIIVSICWKLKFTHSNDLVNIPHRVIEEWREYTLETT